MRRMQNRCPHLAETPAPVDIRKAAADRRYAIECSKENGALPPANPLPADGGRGQLARGKRRCPCASFSLLAHRVTRTRREDTEALDS